LNLSVTGSGFGSGDGAGDGDGSGDGDGAGDGEGAGDGDGDGDGAGDGDGDGDGAGDGDGDGDGSTSPHANSRSAPIRMSESTVIIQCLFFIFPPYYFIVILYHFSGNYFKYLATIALYFSNISSELVIPAASQSAINLSVAG
jgi:hypothetical protein